MISGVMKVGQSTRVQCSVSHTCDSNPPILLLNIPLQSSTLKTVRMSDGKFKTTLTTTLYIERDHQTVECVVRHAAGQTAKSTQTFNAQCTWWEAKTLKSSFFKRYFST